MNQDLRPVNSQSLARNHKLSNGLPTAAVMQSSASMAQATSSIVVESINPSTTDQALTQRDRNSKAEIEFLDTLDEEIRRTEQSVIEMNNRYNHIKHVSGNQSPINSSRRPAPAANNAKASLALNLG